MRRTGPRLRRTDDGGEGRTLGEPEAEGAEQNPANVLACNTHLSKNARVGGSNRTAFVMECPDGGVTSS